MDHGEHGHQHRHRTAAGPRQHGGLGPQPTKRKRADGGAGGAPSDHRPSKQARADGLQRPGAVRHTLLAQYYPRLQTLRGYLLSKLPSSSRLRRKKIASVGQREDPEPIELALHKLLDSTLVGGVDDGAAAKHDDGRREKWLDFSQRGDESYVTLSDGVQGAIFSQSEIVDFAIWLLFSREKTPGAWPKHLLCDGFRRSVGHKGPGKGAPTTGTPIPGLFCIHRNDRVSALKDMPWPQLLALLGRSGEGIMIDLLLDCSIFVAVEAGRANYIQLSGMPISESEPSSAQAVAKRPGSLEPPERPPSDIAFVRSRMLYARAALNARGLVRFGLRHIHVLNRLPYRPGDEEVPEKASKNDENTIRVMMYMFPRQFGLHNVFTSAIDPTQTAQKFQDYTLREEEITKKLGGAGASRRLHLPKRLRGAPHRLVRRLQVLHQRCSYSQLLQHHCPGPMRSNGARTTHPKAASSRARNAKAARKRAKHRQKSDRKPAAHGPVAAPPLSYKTLTELATPISQVSAFCRAVLSKVVPDEFWGAGECQAHNKKVFLKNVDLFIRLRRFESMSLHQVAQGLQTSSVGWLEPPGAKGHKASQTDVRKRREIFDEFLYYLFDSFLIPLIRSNFYVTESSVHRYRLFFFRHDVWRRIAEPAMASLKAKMFEEVKLDEAMRILDSRRLGFSQIRLLPKEASVRPIMNLRRRTFVRGNKKILGPSINSILSPVHTMLKLEKTVNPERLGATMFSVGDLYSRLKAFRERLGPDGGHRYYLAKVDVRAAFDTIPQAAVIDLMARVPSQSRYQVTKHVEVRPNRNAVVTGSKTTKRWHSTARRADDTASFPELVEQQLAPNRRGSVFVDSVVQRSHDVRGLLALMASHVQQNLVKIGKKYYRQRDGIPQGSVLSSTLCNYFYADLERRHLGFLQSDDCLLLRLVDDFLLVTTDRAKAAAFVRTMHGGIPEYGVAVNPSKSLVNFDLAVGGAPVPRLAAAAPFPYCGTRLDPRTLAIARDRATAPRDPAVANALTVERARLPGQNFRRKVLGAFKVQSHLMFFDAAHNSARAALRSLAAALLETAAKAWAYARCLPRGARPAPRLVAATVRELAGAAFRLLTGRERTARHPGYRSEVTRAQVAWLTMRAFRRVLGRKQAQYGEVLAWLDGEMGKLEAGKGGDALARVLHS